MYIETFARSIAVLAIGLPALAQSALSGDAQSAGGGLVSTYPGGAGTCVLLAGPASGSWIDATAKKPGLLQGELYSPSGQALYRMDAQMLVGLLAAPAGAVPTGAVVGDLYDLAAGPGAEPFAALIGTWTRDSSAGGTFNISVLDPASPIFAPIEMGAILGSYGVPAGPTGGPDTGELQGSVSVAAAGGAAAAGLGGDGTGVIIDTSPAVRRLHARMTAAGLDPAGGPQGDPGSGPGSGVGGAGSGLGGSVAGAGVGTAAGGLSNGVIVDEIPQNFGQSAAAGSAHAGQVLSGAASAPQSGSFTGSWGLSLQI